MDYVNTDLKGSKHFRPPPPDPALSPEERAALEAAEAAARQHTASAFVVHRALQYSTVPELAAAYARGWETAKEVDRQWHTIQGEVGGRHGVCRLLRGCLRPHGCAPARSLSVGLLCCAVCKPHLSCSSSPRPSLPHALLCTRLEGAQQEEEMPNSIPLLASQILL